MRRSIDTENGILHISSADRGETRPGEVAIAHIEDDMSLPDALRLMADNIEMDMNGTDPVRPLPEDVRWHVVVTDRRPRQR